MPAARTYRFTFGPWNIESPGDSDVTGDYTFTQADLGVNNCYTKHYSQVFRASTSIDRMSGETWPGQNRRMGRNWSTK